MVGDRDARAGETGTLGEVVDGRYRIVGLVGVGAMGAVYRAEPTEGGDQVAIKLLHRELGAIPEIARRFEREAMATARVGGEHVVPVLDFGTLADGRLYLAMELLRGPSLADLLEREGRLEPERALRIASQILSGLERAHERGVLHRDLKPENIIITEREGGGDSATLLDFGLAKLIGDSALGQEALTRAGTALGTPTYMAPEWISRQSYDARGDLYALSVMLYELLAGRPPFRAEERFEVLRLHATEEVPPLGDVAPEASIPEGVEALVRWGLEKQPEERISSAAAYRELVGLLLADPQTPAPRVRPASEVSGPGAAGDREGDTALMFGLRRRDSDASDASDASNSGVSGRSPAGGDRAPPASPPESPGALGSAAGALASSDPPTGAPHRSPNPPDPPAGLGPPPPAGAARTGRRWTRSQLAALGSALAALAVIAALVALAGNQRGASERVLRSFSDAGLEPGGFASFDSGDLGGECRAGAVSGIPVILCAYDDPEGVADAAEALAARGRVARASSSVLVLRPAPRIDPEGQRADAIVEAFEAAAERP